MSLSSGGPNERHLVPSLITIALIVINVKEVIIGPQISTLARYGLQLASKFHVSSAVPPISLDVPS